MRTNVIIPRDLHELAIIRARRDGITISDLVVRALDELLVDTPDKPKIKQFSADDWQDEPIGKGKGH